MRSIRFHFRRAPGQPQFGGPREIVARRPDHGSIRFRQGFIAGTPDLLHPDQPPGNIQLKSLGIVPQPFLHEPKRLRRILLLQPEGAGQIALHIAGIARRHQAEPWQQLPAIGVDMRLRRIPPRLHLPIEIAHPAPKVAFSPRYRRLLPLATARGIVSAPMRVLLAVFLRQAMRMFIALFFRRMRGALPERHAAMQISLRLHEHQIAGRCPELSQHGRQRAVVAHGPPLLVARAPSLVAQRLHLRNQPARDQPARRP